MRQRGRWAWIKILIVCITIVLGCGTWTISANAAISNEWESDICEERMYNVAYGNGKFVGISYDGFGMNSEDGYDWSIGQHVGSVAELVFEGRYFFAYGEDSACYLSTDGIDWEYISIGQQDEVIDHICYYEGTYYAFTSMMVYGGAGYNRGFVSYIYTSVDGVQWKYQTMEKGITYTSSIIGKNMWLTLGDMDTSESYNQVFWWNDYKWEGIGQISNNNNSLVDGVYGNSGFVVVDSAGNIYTSSNGRKWDLENNKSTESLCKIIYGKNHYIAYNRMGQLFIKNAADSTNTVWKIMELGVSISDIAYGEGKILVCSDEYGVMINEIGASANASLSDVEFINGELVETFKYNKYSYTLCIPQEVTEIKISPSTMENGQMVLLGIDGHEQEIAVEETVYIDVNNDIKSFYLKVIAENGVTYKKYFFEIQWEEKYCIQAENAIGGIVYGGGYGVVGETIELSSYPKDGYVFVGWYENGIFYSSQETIAIIMTDQSRVFTPVFQMKQSKEIFIVLEGDSVEPGEIYELKILNENGEECEGEFLILNPTYSYIYKDENENRYYLNVDYSDRSEALIIQATLCSDKSLQTTIQVPLVREVKSYMVNGVCVPENAGTICGGGAVEIGKNARIYAEENTGYKFSHWNLEGEFYSNEKAFVIGNIQYDYSFEAIYEKLKLSSIEMVKKPNKLVYYEGETFKTDGMQVVASYEDGSSGAVVNYTVNKTSGLALGDDKIIISYVEDDVEKTLELAIQVLVRTDDANSGVESGKEETQQPPEEDGKEEIQQPPEEDGKEEIQQPPEEDGKEETQQPPEEDGKEETQQLPKEEGGKGEIQQPSSENSSNKVTYKLKQKIKKGNLTYQIVKLENRKGSVSVVNGKKNLKNVVIPNDIKVNGYTFKVTRIDKKAFYNQKKLSKVTIGKNVKTIQAYSFGKCKKLKTITIKSTVITQVHKKAFYGIHKKNKVKIPKKCKKKYATWMKKNKLNMR